MNLHIRWQALHRHRHQSHDAVTFEQSRQFERVPTRGRLQNPCHVCHVFTANPLESSGACMKMCAHWLILGHVQIDPSTTAYPLRNPCFSFRHRYLYRRRPPVPLLTRILQQISSLTCSPSPSSFSFKPPAPTPSLPPQLNFPFRSTAYL